MREDGSENGERGDLGPSKEEYLSQPRSRTIREACVKAFHILDAHFGSSKESEANTLTLLKQCEKILEDLGLQPNMHMGQEREFYRDPVYAAEFCGGQLLNAMKQLFTAARVTTEKKILDASEDVTRATSEHGVGVVATDRLSENEIDFMSLQSSTNSIKLLLDAEKETDIEEPKN